VPEPAPKPADWKGLARQRARRREAVGVLVVAQSTVGYAITQLSDGLSPEQAREAAIDAAAELEAVAAALFRLARMGPADRARLARLLVGSGMTRREAAVRLGVCERTIRYYLAGGR
jgi:DNA-directed RNA polymerase specialized sigma24 family protein